MALTQPLLYSQTAFDATQDHVFTFNVIGGDQVVANTLTIINNRTSEQVYSQREVTFTLTHTLPANTLTNGEYYAAILVTENNNGNVSVNSNTIQFYCYTTPIFGFTNLTSGASITTSSYNFEMGYSQSEGESLEQYSFNLYDYASNLISTSGPIYTNSTSGTYTMQYTFGGFSNNTNYYIECTGVTIQGTQITTGLILFGVNYNASSTKLNLVNNCLGGYIYISSTPVTIFGTSNPTPPTYIEYDENTYVDLSQTDSYVLWDNGFTTSTTDWTLSIWGKTFNSNNSICIMKNEKGEKINIEYIIDNETNQAYFSLTASNVNNNLFYKIYSNKIIIPLSNDNIMIWVRRINNIYDLFIFNTTTQYVTEEGEIISFNDAIGNRVVYDLKVTFAPIQDLHGYDSPWPAGGGVNKLDVSEIELNKNYNGSSNTGRCVLYKEYPAGTYIFSVPSYGDFNEISVGCVSTQYDRGSGTTRAITAYNEKQYSFTIDATYKYFYFFGIKTDGTAVTLADLTALKPQLETGNVAHSYAPYSNICPIYGHTDADVPRTGKNFVSTQPVLTTNAVQTIVDFGRDVTISCVLSFDADDITFQSAYAALFDFKKEDGTHQYRTPSNFNRVSDNQQMSTATQPINGKFTHAVSNITFRYLNCYLMSASYGIYTGALKNVQLELGSTATAYSPYVGTTYPIPLGQTVYGGVVDAVNGKAYARPYYPSYNGETLVGPWVSSMDKYEEGATPTTGAQVVDMGGTVTEISLTPIVITTLVGENNIWSNSNGKCIITYAQ